MGFSENKQRERKKYYKQINTRKGAGKKKRKKLKRWIDYLRRQKDDPKKKKSREKKIGSWKDGKEEKTKRKVGSCLRLWDEEFIDEKRRKKWEFLEC